MRLDESEQSDNIEDRRGESGGGGGGGGFGLPIGGGGLGIGTIVVLGLIGWALGIDPRLLIGGAEVLTGGGGSQTRYEAPARPGARQSGTPNDQAGQFVAAILGDTEDRWKEIFQKSNQTYRAPHLVMFRNVTQQPCGGVARAAMGPFYCPNDQKIYIDTSFFNELEANQLQVRVELQADCFAGVWAHHSQEKWKFIEPGDVEAAMQTAAAIGDDRLQRMAQGGNPEARVVPDAFTHGSSAQRVRWFTTGLKSGTVSSCNTFGATQ